MDLRLFSHDRLASLHPSMPLKVHVQQKPMDPETNLDEDGVPTWEMLSHMYGIIDFFPLNHLRFRSSSTLKEHVDYMERVKKEGIKLLIDN